MPSYKLKGVNVSFPYDAYDCQLVYMEYVIGALQKGENALLESPTGTGKTLSLLCASLAWRESLAPESDRRKRRGSQGGEAGSQEDGPRLPTIIYASRTHSQIQQVIQELKATTYRPKMVVLGSREQLCIHPKVQAMRGRAQNHACRTLCKTRSCRHYTFVTEYLKQNPGLGDEPLDIEDFVKIGKTKNPCPYFVTRELHSSAEIIFVPYNYLVDKENRKSLTGIRWENSVIIFDEAHNLEGICADAASFDLPATVLTSCIAEAGQCVEFASQVRSTSNAMDKSVDPESFATLKALFMELEKKISEIPIESEEAGFTRPGQFIYEFLAELKITWETVTMLNDTIDYAISLLQDDTVSVLSKTRNTTCKLETFRDVLRMIFREKDSCLARCYKFHVHASYKKGEKTGGNRGDNKSRMLSWWCFNPGIAMEEFSKMGVRSIVLTSGTLSPLESFAMELKIPFNVRLENPHVIGANQIWVGVVSSGPSGRSLNSSYRTRDSPEYKSELGNTIVNFARIVPDGLLVFFPSYYLLNSCIDAWQTPNQVKGITVWDRICKHKQPVVEPKESALFNQAHEDFLTKLKDRTCAGAVFFAVCRGKVSEGLDFADQTGRAVIITGIPFAMKTDPKVRLKREYLDELSRNQKALKGEEWYVQQASRAVNQAVGRVIRHRNDYGAIILCDERFSQGNAQGQMSLWLRPHLKFYSKFGDAAFTLTRFFKDKSQHSFVKPMVSNTGASSSAAPEADLQSPASIKQVSVSPSIVSKESSAAFWTQPAEAEAKVEQAHTRASFMERITIESENSRQTHASVSFLERKTIEPLHNMSAPAQSQQPLSALLAAKRNQRLSSVGIAPANRASGSTSTEFVYKSETKRFKPDNAKAKEEQPKSATNPTEMKTAGAYLKEVSARLSKQEYQRFLNCMKEFKSGISNLETVLETLSGLFAAPERNYLLSRFGEFLPKRLLPEFNEYLSSKKQ